jgi:hypothetical protein
MQNLRYRVLIAAAIFIIAGIGISIAVAAAGIGASGHGTLLVTNQDGNQVRRQFSFSARRGADGNVNGNAILHNPAFTTENGQNYMLHIDISCMNVAGNTIFFGGTTRRTNDPNLSTPFIFLSRTTASQEPARTRSVRQHFSIMILDDGDPMLCLNNRVGDFPMTPIDAGNIQVR